MTHREPTRLNDDDFIDGLRRQDPLAAKHLYECYVPSLWRFVFFRVDRDSHLAEDIVAETTLALLDATAAGTPIRRPLPWLRTVATRRIQDHFRAVARVQKLIQQAEQDSGIEDTTDPASQHDQRLRLQAVQESMRSLPEVYELALELKYIEQLSVKEMAKRMSTSEKAVESVLFRARGALRKQLKARGITEQSKPSASQSGSADALADDHGPMLFSTRLAGES